MVSKKKKKSLPPITPPPIAPPPPAKEIPRPIAWALGLDGLILCVLAVDIVFPWSSFFGLALLGVGSLMAGSAFGKE
jgi:hypothetical protein